MSFSIDPRLDRLITHRFPAAKSGRSFFPLAGLSGLSGKIVLEGATLLARYQDRQEVTPGVDRRRESRILRKLAGTGLAPEVHGYADNWLLLSWQQGECLSQDDFLCELGTVTDCVVALHQQKLSGYRLSVPELLGQYWQLSCPERRHCGWLRALRRLQRLGEPKPLRPGLLHMDIHAGNIIRGKAGLKLIDWEYASDGDVALELAAMTLGNQLNAAQQQEMVGHYAFCQRMDVTALQRQMLRWQPWLNLLVACWYELRWQRSQKDLFYPLAEQAWQRVLSD